MSRPVRAWAATHAGAVRHQNQDACLCRPEKGLFVVADGVGGHGQGDVASRQVTEALAAIADDLPDRASLGGDGSGGASLAALRNCLQQVHADLIELGAACSPAATTATTVVVLLLQDDHFVCLWAGDSRAYLLRDHRLGPLTSDHSLVQDLVVAGTITEAAAETDPRRHIITRAVGAGDQRLSVGKSMGTTLPGDRFLLCSDGLYRTVELDPMIDGMSTHRDPAAFLLDAALRQGARDNVTAVVVAIDAVHGTADNADPAGTLRP